MTQIRIGEYLLRRIKELGVKSVFGVPGDYELALLDLVPKCGLSWKGNANELVSAYASDGYARVNGIGALITTFGPGELSALNAIGGSYAEQLPIIHVVGYPARQAINEQITIHHCLGAPNYTSYHEMSKHLACASTVLMDPSIAKSEIDRVLQAMIYQSKPCYIGIPGDVAQIEVDEGEVKPLELELPKNDAAEEAKAIERIKKVLASSKSPVAIIDCGVLRAHALDEVLSLIEKLQIHFAETTMTKGFIDERHPLFIGHYPGLGTSMETKQFVADSDCIIWFGPFFFDLNTPTAGQDLKDKITIFLHRTNLEINGSKSPVAMKGLVNAFIGAFNSDTQGIAPQPSSRKLPAALFPAIEPPSGDVIKQDWLWSYLTHFFQPGDVLVTETGTSGVNIRRTILPSQDVVHVTQKLWGSIGFAAAASLGAFVAADESKEARAKRPHLTSSSFSQHGKRIPNLKRNILITGDGSLQMTIQSIGDLLRYGTNAYIFIINNDGYAVERAIHGPDAEYNDIAPYDYSLLPRFFDRSGKFSGTAETYQIRTPSQLEDLLKDRDGFMLPDRVRIVEIFTGKFDYGMVMDVAGPRGDGFNLGTLDQFGEPVPVPFPGLGQQQPQPQQNGAVSKYGVNGRAAAKEEGIQDQGNHVRDSAFKEVQHVSG